MEFNSFSIPFATLMIVERLDFSSSEIVGVSCFTCHYVARVFADPLIFMWRLENPKIPLRTATFAFAYTTLNGLLQAEQAVLVPRGRNQDDDAARIVLGTTIFVVGFLGNRYFDGVLRTVKENSKGKYVVPSTRTIDALNVVAPNYFCECFAMCGYVVLCKFSIGSSMWLIQEIVTLGIRSYDYHVFYLENFNESYLEKKRNVFFPGSRRICGL